MDYGGGMGFGIVREQALTEGQESGAPAISQEPEKANADKATG